MFEALFRLHTVSFACTVNIKIKILLHAQNTIILSENMIMAKFMKTGFSDNKIVINLLINKTINKTCPKNGD